MKHFLFPATIFLALISVVLFSGQQSRPYSQPPPQQQRQPVPQQRQPVQRQPAQRQTTPPKPATTPVAEMPSVFWLPESIKFSETPSEVSQTINLFGDPTKEGLYVTRTLIPKGVRTIPHFHPDSRTVTVMSGVCYYGREDFGENQAFPMPPGTFFTEPAGVSHFIWAKDGDVVVQTTAIGPSGTQFIPEKKSDTMQRQPQ
jgi:quercetin dioxygenase-like cupin family protein